MTETETAPASSSAADVVRLWAPIVLGAVLIVLGLIRNEGTLVTIGAGLLGIPGLDGMLTAHRKSPKGA